jgi:hypothetical protein
MGSRSRGKSYDFLTGYVAARSSAGRCSATIIIEIENKCGSCPDGSLEISEHTVRELLQADYHVGRPLEGIAESVTGKIGNDSV